MHLKEQISYKEKNKDSAKIFSIELEKNYHSQPKILYPAKEKNKKTQKQKNKKQW